MIRWDNIKPVHGPEAEASLAQYAYSLVREDVPRPASGSEVARHAAICASRPHPGPRYADRNAKIVELANANVPRKLIANRFGLARSTVYRITCEGRSDD